MSKPKQQIKEAHRKYLTVDEVDLLCKTAESIGRYRLRNKSMVAIMFRHALRVGEIADLRWTQIDFTNSLLHVRRLKNGIATVHPIQDDVLSCLRQLKKDKKSCYVFSSERGEKMTTRNVRYILHKLGADAEIGFPVHPHMLRHGTGYHLVNSGKDTRSIQVYMGHVSISNTVKYTHLNSKRFEDFWK